MYSEILYLLDRSGSMASIWDDAFSGLNHFIREQQKEKGDCNFQLVAFDNEYEVIREAQDLQYVRPVCPQELFPRGSTAYLDALGRLIDDAGARYARQIRKPEKVIVVVMTDGMENASRNFTKRDIRARIEHQEGKYGWEFIFAGADMDVVGEANLLGVKVANTMSWDKTADGVRNFYGAVGATVSNYRQ